MLSIFLSYLSVRKGKLLEMTVFYKILILALCSCVKVRKSHNKTQEKILIISGVIKKTKGGLKLMVPTHARYTL